MNKGTPLVILSIIGLSLIAGCVGNSPTTSNPSGASPITAKSADWCKAGSKYSATGPTGSASTEVIGIVDFKGHTVCQTTIKYDQSTTDSYVSKDGTYNYYVMKDANGKVTYEGESSVPK